MELTAKIRPTLRGSILTIEREFSTDPPDFLGSKAREFSAKVVELEDAAIREALIKLGWTPPAESEAMLGALLRINEEVWPLVHGLTSRQTLRGFMRTLPTIINWRHSKSPESL